MGTLPGEATLPFHFYFPFSRETTLKMKFFPLGVDLLLKRHHYPVKETGNPKVVPLLKILELYGNVPTHFKFFS